MFQVPRSVDQQPVPWGYSFDAADIQLAKFVGGIWLPQLPTGLVAAGVLNITSDGFVFVGPGGGGTPAPPNRSVQFNDAGAFGGFTGFIYDPFGNLLVRNRISTGNVAPINPALSPYAALDITHDFQDVLNVNQIYYGERITVDWLNQFNGHANAFGLGITATLDSGSLGTCDLLAGIVANVIAEDTTTCEFVYGAQFEASASLGGTVTNSMRALDLIAFSSQGVGDPALPQLVGANVLVTAGNNVVTNAYGVRIEAITGGVTNSYGLYIASQIAGNAYNIFSAGPGINHFGGVTEFAGGATFAAGITVGTAASLIGSSVSMNNGAAAQVGTLTNAPSAGNPTKWIPINDNGVTRYIPTWT